MDLDFIALDEKAKSIMHRIFKLAGRDSVLMEGQGDHGHPESAAESPFRGAVL